MLHISHQTAALIGEDPGSDDFIKYDGVVMSDIKIKNENSVLLRAALEPLYVQSRTAAKTPLIYT